MGEIVNDTLGRLTKKTINPGANSFETSYSYVPGNVTGATTSKLSSISNNGVPIEYQYDANGNITKIIEDGMENRYYYNELNELIEQDNKTLDKSIVYSYDLGGNIIGKTEITYDNGEPGSSITYEYDDTWKDKFTSYDGNGQGDIIGLFDGSGTEVVSYLYDSWGKLISIEGTLKDTVGVKNPYRYR